ncbi:MAG TPA: aspartyl/asparaginyl beta-hydroxylase domain-containing protein [Allosphingosinicella sp.]|nr:aspartyl/asparaginyl beta-hydroxylase domain-containing protein [Allosphingosinicella sp.]
MAEGTKIGEAAGGPRPSIPFWIRMGKRLRRPFNRAIARSSKVGDPPVFDPADFPWIAALESHWSAIRAEADALLAHQAAIPPLAAISPDHRRIAPPEKWKSFFLHGYGYAVEENIRRCPRTAAAVADIPGLNSAFFSILTPGAHIPRHSGVSKAIVTAHLGVVVPKRREACRMQVGDRMLLWEEGRMLVFDDTYHHEVWNESGETRVVLLIQFRRPAGPIGRLLGSLFLFGVRRSRFVQDARSSLSGWEQAMQRIERDTVAA